MSNANFLRLILADTDANTACALLCEQPATRANVAQYAMACRVAHGTSDAIRQAVWDLCAEAVRRRRAV